MCAQASTLGAETRRYDEALAAAMDETLRASKESLSSMLEAKRAMHDRVAAAERRAIRAEHAAKKVRPRRAPCMPGSHTCPVMPPAWFCGGCLDVAHVLWMPQHVQWCFICKKLYGADR